MAIRKRKSTRKRRRSAHGKTAAEKKTYAAYRAAKRRLIKDFFG